MNLMKAPTAVRLIITAVFTTGMCTANAGLIGFTNFFGLPTLVSIDESTGASTIIGQTPANISPAGLAAHNGRLYTFDLISRVLLEIDPQSGAIVETFDIGTLGSGEGAIAFDSTGQGYLSSAGFYEFDAVAGTSLQLQSFIDDFITINGMDFNSQDQLFGFDEFAVNFYSIDPQTGIKTVISQLGVGGSTLGGMAFSPDDIAYAILDGTNLYTIDVATGQPQLIGSTNESYISGLTWIEPKVVPIPASLFLLLSGIASTIAFRYQR